MTVDSLGRGAGNALRIEWDLPRVNIESILPRLPRNLDDMPLNLPRLQPLHRFLDRTKPTDEGGLVRHRRSRLGHLLSTITIHVRGSKNERPLLRVAYIGVGGGRQATYRVFGDLTDIPKGQVFSTLGSPQMRMPGWPVISGDGDRFGVLPG